MESVISQSVARLKDELVLRAEVVATLNDMVGKVERHALRNNLRRTEQNFFLAQRLNDSLLDYIKRLEQKNTVLSSQLGSVRANASLVRDAFVSEIGYFLSESKGRQKLKERVLALESKLARIGADGEDDAEASDAGDDDQPPAIAVASEPTNNTTVEGAQQPETCALEKPQRNVNLGRIICHLEEATLLGVFSYLETVEVLNTAQVCRFFYTRVDSLFGTESAVVKQWSREETESRERDAAVASPAPVPPTPTPSTALTSAAPSAPSATIHTSSVSTNLGEVRWTREILDSLTKKLNAQEMKVVLDVAERLKKQSAVNESLTVENEDVLARLQSAESIRDFLVDKLKSAEKALKALMLENGALKKQSASDQEIIAYLDLHVQELDGKVMESTHRCHHLQAALDLQIGTNSHREEQLLAELNDYKAKYEKLDSAFKSQKKMLVKEVKSLRAQVDTLTQERNIHASRFQLLKEALDSTSSSIRAVQSSHERG